MRKSLLIILPIIISLSLLSGGYFSYQMLTSPKPIQGFVVNHHLFAKNLITDAFNSAANLTPEYTIIISPNHFQLGHYNILTDQANSLLPELQVEAAVFAHEHGINNLLPFVNQYFPHTKIIPLIIKDKTPDTEIDVLAKTLSAALPQDTLIIGSFDFTHQQIDSIADKHDALSQQILNDIDYQNTNNADIDSKPGLRLFLETLSLRGAKKFNLLAHSSSAKMQKNYTTTDNTSYLVGTFK